MRNKRNIQPILNALTAFEEAARTSSFTLAAQSLGIAQPSVSRFIANLEQQIGVQLFARQHNRVSLTEQGEQLYEATALGLGHIRSVLEELSAKSTNNIVTISCTHGFAHMWVLSRVDNLKTRLFNQEVRITTGDHTSGFSIDDDQLAVRFGDGCWPEGESHLLFKEEVFPVCSPELAARYNLLDRKVKPEELAKLPLLVQDGGEYGWLGWSGWFGFLDAAIEIPPGTHMINNYAFVLQAAMEGKGIALAWQNLIEPYLRNNWLVEVPDFRVRTGKGYYLVFSANHPVANVASAWIADTT